MRSMKGVHMLLCDSDPTTYVWKMTRSIVPQVWSLLCLVDRYMNSVRPPSRFAFNVVSAHGFSGFLLMCKENSDHLLIVLSEGNLCFAVWALVAACACGRLL